MHAARDATWEDRPLDSAERTVESGPPGDHIIAVMRELYASGDADGALSLATLVADALEEPAADMGEEITLWDGDVVPSFRSWTLPLRSMDAPTAALVALIDGETPLAKIFDRLPMAVSTADAMLALKELVDEGIVVLV